eukprot:g38724.t1
MLDFPANNIVKFLVGFTNKGNEEFVVESLDASFRYPQDYQFYIQNFTALQLNTLVQSQRQATFEYSFIPAEPMGGRPFGLVINLNYRDATGNIYRDAVFNQTVTITEREDGLDGETCHQREKQKVLRAGPQTVELGRIPIILFSILFVPLIGLYMCCRVDE